jgi:hypothetical protein
LEWFFHRIFAIHVLVRKDIFVNESPCATNDTICNVLRSSIEQPGSCSVTTLNKLLARFKIEVTMVQNYAETFSRSCFLNKLLILIIRAVNKADQGGSPIGVDDAGLDWILFLVGEDVLSVRYIRPDILRGQRIHDCASQARSEILESRKWKTQND